jgi:hypothetical protein
MKEEAIRRACGGRETREAGDGGNLNKMFTLLMFFEKR